MITFKRSQMIGAEFVNDQLIRFSGIQEDHIYGMEVQLEVSVADGIIQKVSGEMKRYTTEVCPEAVPVLQKAVGLSLKKDGWDSTVMKEIGRKGCEHFAEIIIECGRCLEQAVRSQALWQALSKNPGLDQAEFLNSWEATK